LALVYSFFWATLASKSRPQSWKPAFCISPSSKTIYESRLLLILASKASSLIIQRIMHKLHCILIKSIYLPSLPCC
jgi:hypothetical protein